MRRAALLLLSLAAARPDGRPAAPRPACTNLTGAWQPDPVQVTQSADGATVTTSAYWGTGAGNVSGSTLTAAFSNEAAGAPPLVGALSADCNAITWSNAAQWWRGARPPPPPPPIASPSPPPWATRLSIYELNTRTFTSPAGAGPDGAGSGTWAAATQRLPYLADLGVTGLWVAFYHAATAHFYGIASVYAALDPPLLDARLGPAADFAAFVDAAHAAGIRVFLDVIGHGLVNESRYVADNPDWFAGGSWGMTDYDYSNAGFRDWFASVWLGYVNLGVDGFRIDCGMPAAWYPFWNAVAVAAAESGHPVAIFGESGRYHFEQHDLHAPVNDVAAAAAAFQARAVGCVATVQFSCHDSGWESAPGNYFYLRGSRASFGYMGALSPFVPLWLGGDEFDEDPVVDAPALKKDLYGTSGLPGGWMYGSLRQWAQVDGDAPGGRHAGMRDDVRALLALGAKGAPHADVIHHDLCAARIAALAAQPAPALVPYARWAPGVKAVLVLGNADRARAADVALAVPLAAMGLAGRGFYNVSFLFGGDAAPVRTPEAALAALGVRVRADGASGGGLAVLLVVPA